MINRLKCKLLYCVHELCRSAFEIAIMSISALNVYLNAVLVYTNNRICLQIVARCWLIEVSQKKTKQKNKIDSLCIVFRFSDVRHCSPTVFAREWRVILTSVFLFPSFPRLFDHLCEVRFPARSSNCADFISFEKRRRKVLTWRGSRETPHRYTFCSPRLIELASSELSESKNLEENL